MKSGQLFRPLFRLLDHKKLNMTKESSTIEGSFFSLNLLIHPNQGSDISFSAFSKIFFFLLSYHHFGAVLFIMVSMVRIPNRFQTPFSFPDSEGCKARRLIAKPLSRYSI